MNVNKGIPMKHKRTEELLDMVTSIPAVWQL
jgi:hypothetical protein